MPHLYHFLQFLLVVLVLGTLKGVATNQHHVQHHSTRPNVSDLQQYLSFSSTLHSTSIQTPTTAFLNKLATHPRAHDSLQTPSYSSAHPLSGFCSTFHIVVLADTTALTISPRQFKDLQTPTIRSVSFGLTQDSVALLQEPITGRLFMSLLTFPSYVCPLAVMMTSGARYAGVPTRLPGALWNFSCCRPLHISFLAMMCSLTSCESCETLRI